jgi:hypothetical protein
MKLDRTNYEIWIIDYLDGSLDEARASELLSFLKGNPDIKEEFEDFSQPVLSCDLYFNNKDLLKKSVSDLPESQLEFLCVAAAEGDLDETQRNELETVIKSNPDKRKTFELISRLKLIPLELRYGRKSSLKRLTLPQKIGRLSVMGISAAAGIALMISLFNISGKSGDEINQSISINSSAGFKEINVPLNKVSSDNRIEDKKEIKPAPGISVQKTLINNETGKIPLILAKVPVRDSTGKFREVQHVVISKTDFRQEVKVMTNEFTGSLVALNTSAISSSDEQEKPGINDFLARVFREKILKSKTPETGNLKAYEVADAGIIGLNRLLGWDMSLKQNRDEKGDLKSLYFSSKIIKFNSPVRKVQLAP